MTSHLEVMQAVPLSFDSEQVGVFLCSNKDVLAEHIDGGQPGCLWMLRNLFKALRFCAVPHKHEFAHAVTCSSISDLASTIILRFQSCHSQLHKKKMLET